MGLGGIGPRSHSEEQMKSFSFMERFVGNDGEEYIYFFTCSFTSSNSASLCFVTN